MFWVNNLKNEKSFVCGPFEDNIWYHKFKTYMNRGIEDARNLCTNESLLLSEVTVIGLEEVALKRFNFS